jgi:hypothetical protein
MKKLQILAAIAVAVAAIGCGATPGNTDPTGRPAATTAAARHASPKTTVPPVSTEQRNATRTAKNYLEGQSFSRKGLIGQLKYEGYSVKAATAAVDSLGVDWKAQAAATAKNYLDGQPFSKSGLIGQLEYDGFTHAQATYGVSKTGL